MAKVAKAKDVDLTNGVLTLEKKGTYEFEFEKNGKIKLSGKGVQSVEFSLPEYQSITAVHMSAGTTISVPVQTALNWSFTGPGTINITGVGFIQATQFQNRAPADQYKFEPTTGNSLDQFVANLVNEKGLAGALDSLLINGSKADAIKLVWDTLDDQYFYYNTPINELFIDLGIYYAKYLQAGGAPITDIAKYAPDGADLNTTPDRSQMMHDNLLGNLFEFGIADKFGAGADAILDRIEDAGLGSFIGVRGDFNDGRAWYGGYDYQDPSATRAFDQDFFQYNKNVVLL